MTFKVTILGSGSALPMKGKHHSAHALNVHEQFYLVDCGEGTQTRLMEYGINPMKLNAVFISHIHGDHIYGLFPMLSTLGLMGRKRPLQVFAPHPFGELLKCERQYLQNEYPYEIKFTEVDTRQSSPIYENKVMEVWTIPLRHRVPSCGYLFREKEPGLNVSKEAIRAHGLGIAQVVAAKNGKDITLADGTILKNEDLTYIPYAPRSYAYCSDTLYSGKVVSIVKGVDLLYHEATFSAEDKDLAKQTGHSTAAEAGKAALNAEAGKLLIGHFSARYKDTGILLQEAREVFAETFEAEEGQTYEITVKKP